MLNDLRQAIRTLRRSSGFTVVAVATLALGIGANTALFSVADAVLLRPLPYPDPQRIMRIDGAPFGFSPRGMVVAKVLRESRAFNGIGLYATGGLNVGGEAGAERARAAAVTGGFFAAMGTAPIVGRPFTDDEVTANVDVAVISHGLWRRRFAGEAPRTIVLNGKTFVVVGVMPARFDFPDHSDVWIPVGSDPQITGQAFAPHIVARLGQGITPDAARQAIVRINDERSGGKHDPRERPVVVVPLREELIGTVRPLILTVWAAVFLVLLVACINTANLLLARVSAREREMLVRRALGASRFRLMRHLLVESAVLSALAGAVAVPSAWWTLDAIRVLVPPTLHGAADIAINARAVAATAGLCVLATIVFGLAPSLSLRGIATADALRGSSSTTADPFWRRFRSALVIAEIGIALVLLAGATTIVRTVSALMRTDLGARGERVLTMELTLPSARYGDAARIAALYERLDAQLRSVPGIEAVGATSLGPGSREVGIGGRIDVEGVAAPADPDSEFASQLSATPEYFRAIGIDLIAGHPFTAADVAGAPRVAIVGQEFARAVNLDPQAIVGRRMMVGFRTPREWATIVGVARDVRLRGPELGAGPQFYVPFAQTPSAGTTYVAVKAAGDPRAMAAAVRAAVAAVDADLPVYNMRTFDEIRATYVSDRRFAMTLMLIFGALAAALAAVGLYGVVSYLLQLRTREIGIRMALGASPAAMRWQMVKGGVLHAVAGIAIGAAFAQGLSRVLVSRVPGIQPVDAASIAMLSAAMIAAAIATTWIPARRVTRIDPMRALRVDG